RQLDHPPLRKRAALPASQRRAARGVEALRHGARVELPEGERAPLAVGEGRVALALDHGPDDVAAVVLDPEADRDLDAAADDGLRQVLLERDPEPLTDEAGELRVGVERLQRLPAQAVGVGGNGVGGSCLRGRAAFTAAAFTATAFATSACAYAVRERRPDAV